MREANIKFVENIDGNNIENGWKIRFFFTLTHLILNTTKQTSLFLLIVSFELETTEFFIGSVISAVVSQAMLVVGEKNLHLILLHSHGCLWWPEKDPTTHRGIPAKYCSLCTHWRLCGAQSTPVLKQMAYTFSAIHTWSFM